MARKRARRTSKTVKFTTRRGRKVSFKLTGRGHRITAHNRAFGKASAACRRKHLKPFTKAFGKCMKKKLKSR